MKDSALRPSILVTGASSGIGRAATCALRDQGFDIYASVRGQNDADSLHSLNVESDTSGKILPVLMDITDFPAVESTVASLSDKNLVGVLNNAGIAKFGPLESQRSCDVSAQMQVNVCGTINLTRALIPLLRENNGRIVTISSISGLLAPPGLSLYSASKFALEGFSDSIRVDLKDFGINVSLIEPGKIATPIWDKAAGVSGGDKTADLAHYDTLMRFFQRFMDQEKPAPMAHVTRAIVHAFTSTAPKPRYVIGRSAKVRSLLRLLPTRIVDGLVYKSIYR